MTYRVISQQESNEKLGHLRKFAEESGFEVLEQEWLGGSFRHLFRHIESGAERYWTPNNIFNSGFPKYLSLQYESFLLLKQLSRDNGFELLETEWLGTAIKHRFQHMDSGKTFEDRPANLFKRGFPKDLNLVKVRKARIESTRSWTQYRQERFDELKQMAVENGHELLEHQWLGDEIKHRFRHIESGVERELSPTQLTRKGFLPVLRSDPEKLEQLRQQRL